jgi:hypothetical protein
MIIEPGVPAWPARSFETGNFLKKFEPFELEKENSPPGS